jgi:hypothetical protein
LPFLLEEFFGGAREIKMKVKIFCEAGRRLRRLAAGRSVKVHSPDFRQKKFGFYPKGTARLKSGRKVVFSLSGESRAPRSPQGNGANEIQCGNFVALCGVSLRRSKTKNFLSSIFRLAMEGWGSGSSLFFC